MKASSFLIFAGLGAAVAALSGCTTYDDRRYPVSYEDQRTQEQRAAECVANFEPGDKAPQIMTYDSESKTEVHLNTDGRKVDVTAQNATDDTAMGMGGKVGGNIPEACTDAYPKPAPAIPKRRGYRTGWNSQH